jgi:hypothetical protein
MANDFRRRVVIATVRFILMKEFLMFRIKKLIFFLIAIAASVLTQSACAQTEITVVNHPANGAIKFLPDGAGVVYLGTSKTDNFCFASIDDSGASVISISIDMNVGHDVSVLDFGGPLPVTILTFKLLPEQFIRHGFSLDEEDEGYVVIIKVKQPLPGKRKPFVIDPVDGPSVGHTFVEIIDGATGVATCHGLYPTKPVNPFNNPAAPGIINNDAGHDWDVKYEIPISREDYDTLVCGIECDKANPPIYDLNNNNCTDWAINVLTWIDIQINTNPAVWPGGGGHNCGDLGEDLILIGGIRNTPPDPPAPPIGGVQPGGGN